MPAWSRWTNCKATARAHEKGRAGLPLRALNLEYGFIEEATVLCPTGMRGDRSIKIPPSLAAVQCRLYSLGRRRDFNAITLFLGGTTVLLASVAGCTTPQPAMMRAHSNARA